MKDATALFGSAIYAREQAEINENSLSDLCTKNSVSVSPLERIIEEKRHCGVIIDIPLGAFDEQATAATVGIPFYYKIPQDITFTGNLNIDDKKHFYRQLNNNDQYKTANIFYLTTLNSGSKAIGTLYPNKYMLAWKLASDNSFI
ncbi:MAG: hypothetical protein EZS28_006249 [Streblomastix strix]|uniref:Uncharacterized protein n=1 Tax=Streblomastix strix TaxID=222440 RepID=A0A5J4WV46_9EUKA|nr:MAG: hypothetical protein EZS28_006249 [Streblomastix strix]